MKERRYFQFFREWHDLLQEIENTETRCKIYDWIVNFALNGIEPAKEDVAGVDKMGKICWCALLPQLQNSRKNFVNGSKSKGAPKGSRNAAKFVVPTLNEVLNYFAKMQYNSDGETFFDYNETTGWDNAKRHFKTWRAAADRWEERQDDF